MNGTLESSIAVYVLMKMFWRVNYDCVGNNTLQPAYSY